MSSESRAIAAAGGVAPHLRALHIMQSVFSLASRRRATPGNHRYWDRDGEL